MLLELIFNDHLNNITHRCTHGCTDNIPSSRAPVGAKNIQMSSIIHIIFILSPSLPEVRVRVATETARCGPGRQEKDWPGPEREGGQVGTLLLSHSYLQQRPGGWWAWPGSSRAGCQTGQGSSAVVQSSAQAVWAPADFPGTGHWHSTQLQVTQTPPQAQDWFHSGQAARLLLLALPEKWPTRNEVYYQVAGIR